MAKAHARRPPCLNLWCRCWCCVDALSCPMYENAFVKEPQLHALLWMQCTAGLRLLQAHAPPRSPENHTGPWETAYRLICSTRSDISLYLPYLRKSTISTHICPHLPSPGPGISQYLPISPDIHVSPGISGCMPISRRGYREIRKKNRRRDSPFTSSVYPVHHTVPRCVASSPLSVVGDGLASLSLVWP